MWIEQIRLTNWKVYRDAEFNFPEPCDKPIVLIGGKNGSGKTSLLQGLLFGLYGRYAVDLMPETFAPREHYNEILRKSANKTALKDSVRPRATIFITLRDGNERIEIERVYHFRPNNPPEEELKVKKGQADSESLELIDVDVENSLQEQQDFIDSNILPHDLARFFFFDGEQVQRLANSEQSDVTTKGLEQMFGLTVLRTLQGDLKTLGVEQRKAASKGAERAEIVRIETRIEQLEGEISDKELEIAEARREIPELKREKDTYEKRVSAAVKGDNWDVQEIVENIAELSARRKDIEKELDEELGEGLSLALASRTSEKLREQLRAEARFDDWEVARKNAGGQADKLERNFREMSEPQILPELLDEQWESIAARIRKAYEGLFSPPPDNIAKYRRHGHIGRETRGIIEARLMEVGNLASKTLVKRLDELERLESERRTRESDRDALQKGTAVAVLVEKVTTLSIKIGSMEARVEDREKEQAKLKADLQNLKSELGRLVSLGAASDINGKVANKCNEIRDMIGKYIDEVKAIRHREVSKEMTRVYKLLARKEGLVEEIRVKEDGGVIFYGKDGARLDDQEFSAGEKEIFALSWLAAAGKVGGNVMPIMIDTPMARLDVEHRKNICTHYLPNAAPQVIVLSTDTEIEGEYEEIVEPHIAKCFDVKFDAQLEESTVISDEYFLGDDEVAGGGNV